MIVIIMKATWIKPSCKAMGIPIFSILPITGRWGLKSDFCRTILFLLIMTIKEITTLIAYDTVVPSAAPAGPRRKTPMKR